MTNNTSSAKKTILYVLLAIILIGLILFAIYFFDVDQTQEARLPDVDVSVEEGQMPKFDVDAGDVNVGTKEVEVDVPTADVKTKTVEVEVPAGVDVGTEKGTIEVPTLGIEPPERDGPAGKE